MSLAAHSLSHSTSLCAANDNQRVYLVAGNLLAEHNGVTGAVIREYIYVEGMPLAQVEGGNTYYFHSDQVNQPQKITDGSDAVVWNRFAQPFGENVSVSGATATPLRFPGQYSDPEDANSYNYFRDYDPTLGRYLQPDPIGLDGGLNLYGYATQNPLLNVDPLGLQIVVPGPVPLPLPLPPSAGSDPLGLKQGIDNLRTLYNVGGVILNPATFGEPPAQQAKDDAGTEDKVCPLPENDDERCRKVKEGCLDTCSETALPTIDYGSDFYKCVKKCMVDAGCEWSPL